ncbi:hypothetical protein FHW79_005252 [Azospirillum sp. OGB3]|uniref:hypothetical protein n=1 Tax=Azospirillum sp. OGB3 TaxID=2587012 RepID=UPI001605A54B|nr:hypothetical protein [Azospirillum sp. OGB3]MBB3267591.1 hypothetical protein [Azospirillum sp. OGB3]
MKAVKFKEPATVGTLYNAGEVARFATDVADALVKAKVAEEVRAEAKKAGDAGK